MMDAQSIIAKKCKRYKYPIILAGRTKIRKKKNLMLVDDFFLFFVKKMVHLLKQDENENIACKNVSDVALKYKKTVSDRIYMDPPRLRE